jgi:phosphoribosyl-AMP cyclohydrolase
MKKTKCSYKDFKFDANGLIPAIIQDYKTKDVLMVAYMNKESLRRTIKSGKCCYWSRSRKEYWVKGATSGHFQFVKSLAYDCDMDALLIKVRQVGVACHTGNRSCFYRKIK